MTQVEWFLVYTRPSVWYTAQYGGEAGKALCSQGRHMKHIQFSYKYCMPAHKKYHQNTLLNPCHPDFFLESLWRAFLSSQLTLALNLPESLLVRGLSLQKACIQLLLVGNTSYLFKRVQCGPKLWTGNILIRLVKARGSRLVPKRGVFLCKT